MSTSKFTSLVLTMLSMFTVAELAAQPELTEGDFLSIGDRATLEHYGAGNIDSSALTAPGPTADWDFTVSFGTPPFGAPTVFALEGFAVDAGPVDAAKTFPGADRAVKRVALPPPFLPPDVPPLPESAEWNYFSCDPGGRTWHGTALTDEEVPDPVLLVASPPTLDYPLPFNLGAEWTVTHVAGTDIINDVQLTATVDAWGTATLPGIGTVDCVRVNRSGTNFLSDGTVDPPVVFAAFSFREYVWVAEDYGIVAKVHSGIHPVDAMPEPGFSTADSVERMVEFTPASDGPDFVRGEVNGDGSYNIVDAILIVLHVFREAPPLACASAADLDDDGTVSVVDVLYSLHSLFSQGPAPEAPFPSCGPDPTSDLPCALAACP